jgi:hypothetical protein
LDHHDDAGVVWAIDIETAVRWVKGEVGREKAGLVRCTKYPIGGQFAAKTSGEDRQCLSLRFRCKKP